MSLKIGPETLSTLDNIYRFLKKQQIKCYLVGGFVRDAIIERSTADIDIAIDADALKIAADMADAVGGKFVPLDEMNHIARVVLFDQNGPATGERWNIDLSTIEEDILHDLGRRDFTIDAMAIDLQLVIECPDKQEIIDPFKGQDDLQLRSIKVVTKTAFKADPARLLRAIRLAAELNFSISSETESLIRQYSGLITLVPGERLREELLKILAVSRAGRYIRYTDDLGLLTAIIPELEASRGVEQPKEHHWDVLNHSLETVRAVDFLLRQGDWQYAPPEVLDKLLWSEDLSRHFASEVSSGSTNSSLLKLAALLHDISKPETKIISKERVRFFGHTEQGAELVTEILDRLRFSNKEIRLVEMMVRYHMRPTQMSNEGLPTQRAIYRYFRDTGSACIDILFLSLADHLAARGPDLDVEHWQNHVEQVNYILLNRLGQAETTAPPKLLDGHDLINLFGLKPGPEIKQILESVKEAQAAGELKSREEALSYVENRLLYKE